MFVVLNLLVLLPTVLSFVTSPFTLSWMEKTWYIKAGVSLPGPPPYGNTWNPNGVYVDTAGLHLSITPTPGTCTGWTSSEVWTVDPVRYGTFVFEVTVEASLDPFVTFGLFTWDDDEPTSGEDYAGRAFHREFDVEYGQWGSLVDQNVYQFVVQPWQTAENLIRLPFPSSLPVTPGALGPMGGGGCDDKGPDGFSGGDTVAVTWSMVWAPGSILFTTFAGHTTEPSATLAQWQAPPGSVPTYGTTTSGARVHLNLWLNDGGGAPLRGRRVDVVVKSFTFTPSQ